MIYRFKIWFEDQDDVIRWIDIPPSHTFLDFHKEILRSISFEDVNPSSFFKANQAWKKGLEVTLEDMGFEESADPALLMKEVKLRDLVNDPHQKFIYIHDFIEMWTLYVELHKILEEESGVTYPRLFKSEGVAPKQKDGAGKFMMLDDAEMDFLAAEILEEKAGRLKDNSALADVFGELELEGTDQEEDDDEEDDDHFGPFYGDGLDEDENKSFY
jgi:hypothetical protein